MHIVHTLADLRRQTSATHSRAFVPTMGNLHEGHLNLVRLAREHGQRVVTSIFVNRLQFAPHEDFDSYPRTLERDAELLEAAGCDILFAPNESELYPEPQRYVVQPPAELADILEGHFRPGFFTGVCTVVMKLFQCVQPQAAVFGKKDYQQLMVIRGMVRQFAMPVEIIAGETARAGDGLALSSRNGYLSAEERGKAIELSAALREMANSWVGWNRDLAVLEEKAMTGLREKGWAPDYVTVRRQVDLGAPTEADVRDAVPLVALGAARIGHTRLIDNLELGL